MLISAFIEKLQEIEKLNPNSQVFIDGKLALQEVNSVVLQHMRDPDGHIISNDAYVMISAK